ncbi:hypothetical protein [Methylotenera sp. 1P/1]|uniref:hypothetical protein n=1 Tax=Methylotenera sp. 1P/1 TaxID=1131551 RepID=UPI00036BF196|nr:hypothetical protein [Methylotenera sp. 1P/1]
MSKLDELTSAYRELAIQFKGANSPSLTQLAEALTNGIDQLEAIKGVKASALVAGLEQGLREIPMSLSHLPKVERLAAYKLYRHAVEANANSFFRSEAEHLSKIVARGKIKGENEWHIVRHQIDLLEQSSPSSSELSVFYRLADAYEAAA